MFPERGNLAGGSFNSKTPKDLENLINTMKLSKSLTTHSVFKIMYLVIANWKIQAHKEFDEGIAKVELLSYVCYWVLSGSKLLCGILSSDIYHCGSVNRLRGPKKVILVASREGWVEQSPLGVCPLLHIIQVLITVSYMWLISMSVFLEVCSVAAKFNNNWWLLSMISTLYLKVIHK